RQDFRTRQTRVAGMRVLRAGVGRTKGVAGMRVWRTEVVLHPAVTGRAFVPDNAECSRAKGGHAARSNRGLFVAEGFYRIQTGGFAGGPDSEEQADSYGDHDSKSGGP